MPRKVKVTTKLAEGLLSGLKGELHQPQLANVAGHFIQMVGGERAFARLLVDEYKDKDCTPTMKTRIMQMVLSAMKFGNERQSGVGDDLGLMNDEDLEKTLEATILSIEQKEDDDVEPETIGEPSSAEQPQGQAGTASGA